MALVRLALEAMATRFELVLHGPDRVHLRAAGEAALAEIRHLEAQLSYYRPSSVVSQLNAQAAEGPVVVAPWFFDLLAHAQRLHALSEGAFDLTVAPLLRAWGFTGEGGHTPTPDALAAARRVTGMANIHLDGPTSSVRFARPGVRVDFGAIGKGYAIDEAIALLREAGVAHALLHGGTSTVYALGTPEDADHWNVALSPPIGADVDPDQPLAVVALQDEALSVSAVWGKQFIDAGKAYGHVLDPRTGHPVERALLAAVVLPSATETDALSTALLVLGDAGHDRLAHARPAARSLVASAGPTLTLTHRGLPPMA